MSSIIFNPLGTTNTQRISDWDSVMASSGSERRIYAPALRHHAVTTHHRSPGRGLCYRRAPLRFCYRACSEGEVTRSTSRQVREHVLAHDVHEQRDFRRPQ